MKEQFMTIKEEREMRKNKQSVISRAKKWFSHQGYLKNAFADKLNAIRKTTAVLVGIAMAGQFTLGMLYTGAAAGDPAHLNGSLAVANVTTGGSYNENSVPALVDQVVQFELAIHNTEPPTSGTDAYNVLARMQMPTAPNTALTVTGTAQGTNTNLLSDIAAVTTQMPANLEYIPGTAMWRYNRGTNEHPQWVTQAISDTIVTTGVNLGTIQPCWNMQQTVTIQARVTASSLRVEKSVAIPGQPWVNENTANPGDTLSYLIGFTNTGNTTLNEVIVGDNLPQNLTYVAGSSILVNTQFPNGTPLADGVTTGGIRVGVYNPGSNGYVRFRVTVNEDISCGSHRLQNIGMARAAGQTPDVWDSAYTNVNRVCETAPEFVLSKAAFNVTQNVDATTTRAHAGDIIRYELHTHNVGDEAGNYLVADNIADVLQYTSITDSNGATVANGQISFGTHSVGINETLVRSFEVRVNPVSQWPVAGDTTLTNVYGNNITVLLGFTVINPSKSAFNNTQSVNAVTSVARAGDQITYTLLTRNLGNEAITNHVVSDDISDVLEYATVLNAMGGNVSGGVISWPAQNIPVGGQLTNTFVIQVTSPIPSNVQNGNSYDYVMQNIYGDEVRITVERPSILGGMIAGASATRLAAAGAGNVLLIGLMSLMFSSSLFLYVREKYLLERAMRMAV